eukprot:CAMPEP_0196735480 /NCGR_PEP_ID=MMETSP1091-20130531/13918_1 /TAXON_ID=302021 /ORGANISM="Rhodomonas sp., Strain CCMP768" /LENGTH=224 /DNA_ID=CAMNT_0042079127 /DNA_START=15 /DNA_END=685 /DNA_ORIENTATION=+
MLRSHVGGKFSGAALLWVLLSSSSLSVGAEVLGCTSDEGFGLYQCTDQGAAWSEHITTYPPHWYRFFDGLEEKTAIEYIREVKPCCRHCVWSLGYPLAIPALLAISPKQDTCGLFKGGFSQCYLNCSAWEGDFDLLDVNTDSKLNATEMQRYISDQSVAPAQNYKLYTGGALSYNSDLSRLEPNVVFFSVDLNRDNSISREEWRVYRHFWSPTLVSRAGPSKVP